MKLITRFLYLSAAGIMLLTSCAKEQTESYDKFENQALEAWMTQNRRELLKNYQSEGGYYVEILAAGNPDAKPVNDTACWVKFDFSGRDLSGNIVLTRRANEARQLGTFTKYTHYVPFYRYCGTENTSLMEGTFLAMRNTLHLDPDYAAGKGVDPEFLLREGSRVRLYLPSRVVGNGVEGDGGYEGQFDLSAKRPLIVEMEIRDTLNEYGFPGDDTPIIKGSALKALEYSGNDPDAPELACIWELMNAVDTYIPTPDRKADLPFLMPVEDVFTITGRGTVATGRVERGQLRTGDELEIVGLKEEKGKTVCTGIEMFRKTLDYAEAGDNIGALLRGVQRTDIERGQVLAKPGTIHPHTKFVGQVYVLTKDEGGRHTPFFNNYRPQFYFRTTDVTGIISLPAGVEMCMPGDNIDMTVELIAPIAIEEGLRFAIREGGRTVGSGVVIEIIE